MTNAERKALLTDTLALLSVPGIGRGRFNKLVSHFGSPAAVLKASVRELTALNGISEQTAEAIRSRPDRETASRLAAIVISKGWTVLYPDSREYPAPLLTIADYPPVLFRIGRPWSPEDRMVAMVGTRHATERGRRFATALATEMAAAGLVVVSGMAEGIDSCAHRGALAAGGVTVAVWGRPLDVVFPEINRGLAEQIEKTGAIYSEYPPETPYSPADFPNRNRIISGLSEAVVVVEAGKKSGALITAQYALEQNRELFAVPGAPDAAQSAGTNALIKSGARLLTSLQDIFDELPRLKGAVTAKRHVNSGDMTASERRLVELLADGPVQIDELSRRVGLGMPETMELLLALELRGVIQEIAGKRYTLCE